MRRFPRGFRAERSRSIGEIEFVLAAGEFEEAQRRGAASQKG